MIVEKKLYSLNDVAIMPSSASIIEHRCECNPYLPDGMLPLFTAPMSTVVNSTNYNKFIKNNINPIIPRTGDIQMRLQKMNDVWCAFSLAEFKMYFLDTYANNNGKPMYVLIDIANGGMTKLLDYIKMAKKKYSGKIVIMAGNVANPETYVNLSLAGADYVRLSVGTGAACFIDGTKVKMGNGEEKNIEDVKIGDNVLTKDGKYDVLNTIRYVSNEKKYTINNSITCTENHEFYVINKSDKDKITQDNIKEYAYFVSANKIDKDKHLLIKSLD